MKTLANVHGTFLNYVKTILPISTRILVMDTWFLYLIKWKLKLLFSVLSVS